VTQPASKSRPFKKFYCDDEAIFQLPGIAFKIWMYHYKREGKARESWPSVPTICNALKISENTLFKWRKYLIENGWLEKVGNRHRLDGEFTVPVFKVKRGTVPQNLGDGEGNRTPKLGVWTHPKTWGRTHPKTWGMDAPQNLGYEVDSGVLDSEEVESGLLDAKPAHSLESESTPKPSGKRKSLEDFPYYKETREEREEFRAILKEMAKQ